ncbi:hypothetical protein O6H91_17G038800 [Diphasiastrum complanatum]|uniref:Uncharacterized protein n=1 Tax=Diphasiastrum complanatum TaxID=34168 RepID=A0ACC2B5W7_DIPCM|nr:hypothetical protein O6H91_17G038800 [Diphasiastrum complanatum]
MLMIKTNTLCQTLDQNFINLRSKTQTLSNNKISELIRMTIALQDAHTTFGTLAMLTKTSMPKRGSIRSLQHNVTRTRMGHGKKRMSTTEGFINLKKLGSMEEPMIGRPTSSTIYKRVMSKKRTRGVYNLFVGGMNTTTCKNCSDVVTRQVEICQELRGMKK